MGCASSIYAVGRRKKKLGVPEVVIFVPSLRIPFQSDLQRPLRGMVPKDLIDRLFALRNQIAFIAEETGGSAITELQRALEEYLSILIGLTKKEHGLAGLTEFKWKNLMGGLQEISVANAWFEALSVVHLMAMLTLSDADSMMIPKDFSGSGSGSRILSSDCERDAVGLLLKASGQLEFCVRNLLVHIPLDIRKKLPSDLQRNVLEAISIQALGQGTEIQLGLAVESQNATLSVKRRLACEQMTYFSQAYHCLSECNMDHGHRKKHFCFLKWKFLEAKAAAYYFHGLILDKGKEPSCHVSSVCCFLAAEELLVESKKACLTFFALPHLSPARCPPLWGAMNHLHHKIPEVASTKSKMYGYLLEKEKALQELPDVPEFQLSLSPDEYEIPEMDGSWQCEYWETKSQPLKEHLKDSQDETEIGS